MIVQIINPHHDEPQILCQEFITECNGSASVER